MILYGQKNIYNIKILSNGLKGLLFKMYEIKLW
jgi:hypothetical protein